MRTCNPSWEWPDETPTFCTGRRDHWGAATSHPPLPPLRQRRQLPQLAHFIVAARHPEQAERVTDYMSTVMAGLSASARNGHDLDRLLAAARLAGAGLEQVVRG